MSRTAILVLGLVVAACVAGAVWWNQRAIPGRLGRVAHARAAGCSAAPLTRAEAIRQGETRLGKFSASLGLRQRFSRSSARFDDDSRSWIVTFRSPDCMVMMVVDRCKPDELGGTTDCHAG